MSSPSDKRQYPRLKCVFPVDFSIVRLQGDLPGIDCQEASTCNISKEGISIETKSLSEATIKYLKDQSIFLELRLKVPVHQSHIKAVCDVVWYEVVNDKIIVGLKFRTIQAQELKRILCHAMWFTYSSTVVFALCAILFLVLIVWGIMTKFIH